MAPSESRATNQAGPFQAGSTSSELIARAGQPGLALRLLDQEERIRDYYARCEALRSAAREFFYDYEGTSTLIFQKTRDVPAFPDFIEYILCWLAEDRLCSLILSGVTSDAGSHAQINDQETAFWEHTAEVALALAIKYPESPKRFLNFFNFETYQAEHQLPSIEPATLFHSHPRLVTVTEDNETSTSIQTHYCGPSLILPSRKKHDSDGPTAATHSSQDARKLFANDEFVVIYDYKIERYVRTIESIHVFENLVYIARKLADDIGKRLNAGQCERVANEARKEIDRWNDSVNQAASAKKERISRLSQIL